MNQDQIKSLVGDVTEAQLTHIDSYVWEDFALFLPITGQCGYAIKENHTHPGYSFILCPNSITISGLEINKSSKNEILIAMSPDFPHHEDSTDNFVRYFAIFIDKDYFETIYRLYRKDIPIYKNSIFEVTTDLIPILKSFITEYRDKHPGYKRQLSILRERIVHLIIRNTLDVENSSESISRRFEVEAAIEFIHANYMNKITVDEVSNFVNYSSSCFSRMFSKEMGVTLSAYIVQIRLEKAKKLMEIGKRSLTEISYFCGFNSPSHFSASYKKVFGSRPSDYQSFVGRKAEF